MASAKSTPPRSGRTTESPAEGAGEILAGLETTAESDLRDAHPRVSLER